MKKSKIYPGYLKMSFFDYKRNRIPMVWVLLGFINMGIVFILYNLYMSDDFISIQEKEFLSVFYGAAKLFSLLGAVTGIILAIVLGPAPMYIKKEEIKNAKND